MEVSKTGRSPPQYGSVPPVGFRAASVLMRADFGRLTINERSAAAPAVSVSAGFSSEMPSDCAESDEEMYCCGSAGVPQERRARGGLPAEAARPREAAPRG